MADAKITALTALTSADSGDLLVAVDVSTGITKKITKEQFLGYKVYRALISQTGTDAPTAVVLENTLGEVPTFNYGGVGDYSLEIVASLFVAGKTFVMPNPVIEFTDANSAAFLWAKRNSNQLIELKAFSFGLAGGGAAGAPTATDAIIVSAELQILVYP